MLDYSPNTYAWGPFWFVIFPYIEQDNLFKRAYGTGAGWGGGNHNAVIPTLVCPSDPSMPAGSLVDCGANSWFGTSYAPNYLMFGTTNPYNSGVGAYIAQGRYKVGNIPDGTSNTIGVVERFGECPYYGWSNVALYPMSWSYWGYNSNGSLACYWSWALPQIQPPLRNWVGNVQPAHPYYPTTGHPVCLVMLMDASVRSVGGSLSQGTWNAAIQPDDGQPLGANW
jgi:hypothetical protein